MSKNKKSILLLFAVLPVVSIVLAGCGTKQATKNQKADMKQTVAPAAQPTEQPVIPDEAKEVPRPNF